MLEGLFDSYRWEQCFKDIDDILMGFGMTLKVTLIGWIVAMAIGILFGILSTKKSRVIKVINKIYVEFFQNTPLALQVFFYYSGVPVILRIALHLSKPIRLSKLLIGVLGVGLYHGAYISEVIRTGIESVPKGQKEAAVSQGFTEIQSMIYIVLPQTMKMILPPLTNQTLALLKNTSVLTMVAGFDLMYYADVNVCYTGYMQGYVVAAVLYFMVCFPLAMLVKVLEKRSKQTPKEKKSKKKLGVA